MGVLLIKLNFCSLSWSGVPLGYIDTLR